MSVTQDEDSEEEMASSKLVNATVHGVANPPVLNNNNHSDAPIRDETQKNREEISNGPLVQMEIQTHPETQTMPADLSIKSTMNSAH